MDWTQDEIDDEMFQDDEDCDFECANRDGEWFAGSRRYCKKHRQLFYTQVDLARHALGLDKQHTEAYRNHFTCPEGERDYVEWMDMVAKGLAIRVDRREMMGGNWLFHLTREGAEQALFKGDELGSGEYPQAQATQ